MTNVESFARWFLTTTPVLGWVPVQAQVSRIQDATGYVVYRCGQFQVQVFLMLPNSIIPQHTHPNVDSIEVYVGGEIRFTIDGKYISDPYELDPDGGPFETSQSRGLTVRVQPNTPHGGVFGQGGGVFMSIQHWLHGVQPHDVALDYSGLVMGPDHFRKVTSGEPTLSAVTWKDAAPLETEPPFPGWV